MGLNPFFVMEGLSNSIFLILCFIGFVVPRRMIQMLHEGRHTEYMEALQSAIIRRHVRLLMPAFFSALLIIVFYHTTGFEENWSGGRASNIFVEFLWWILDCLHTLNYFTAFAMRYNPVTWTIVVELKGSMSIFAWLFVVHRLRPQRRILLTLALSFFLVLFGLGKYLIDTFAHPCVRDGMADQKKTKIENGKAPGSPPSSSACSHANSTFYTLQVNRRTSGSPGRKFPAFFPSTNVYIPSC